MMFICHRWTEPEGASFLRSTASSIDDRETSSQGLVGTVHCFEERGWTEPEGASFLRSTASSIDDRETSLQGLVGKVHCSEEEGWTEPVGAHFLPSTVLSKQSIGSVHLVFPVLILMKVETRAFTMVW